MKKIVKQIGKELAADPELAHDIIQPLKMQGVEAMGEIGMQVRLKMMTKPGEQFIVRRRAYAMLKQASPRTASGSPCRRCRSSEGDPAAAAAHGGAAPDRPAEARLSRRIS